MKETIKAKGRQAKKVMQGLRKRGYPSCCFDFDEVEGVLTVSDSFNGVCLRRGRVEFNANGRCRSDLVIDEFNPPRDIAKTRRN